MLCDGLLHMTMHGALYRLAVLSGNDVNTLQDIAWNSYHVDEPCMFTEEYSR